jgi:hypothetical protein
VKEKSVLNLQKFTLIVIKPGYKYSIKSQKLLCKIYFF